jgi:hypothetical protein
MTPEAWQRLIDALQAAIVVADDPAAAPESVADAADLAFSCRPPEGGGAELLPLAREAERLHRELAVRLRAWRDRCAAEGAETAVRARALDAYQPGDGDGARFVDRRG